MRDQPRRLHGARRDQVEERFHVALLGPAHVADGVIDAVFFVRPVVAAGPVRARQPHLQLFLVVGVARHVHADHAHGDHHGAIAGQAWRELDRIARARRGGDQNGIGAAPEAEGAHLVDEVRVGSQTRAVSALGARELDLVGGHVDAEDPAAGRLEQLHRQLADQAEADHDARLAQPHVGDAHALQRNRADRDERGVVQADRVWHAHRQVSGHRDNLGVVRLASAGAGDPIAARKRVLRGLTNLQDGARAAIAEGYGHVEPTADGLDGRGNPVASQLVGHLLDQLGSLAGGVEQVRAAGFDEHALGARADQRPLVLDQQPAARRQRRGHLDDARRARATVLQNLLHLSGQYALERMIAGASSRA